MSAVHVPGGLCGCHTCQPVTWTYHLLGISNRGQLLCLYYVGCCKWRHSETWKTAVSPLAWHMPLTDWANTVFLECSLVCRKLAHSLVPLAGSRMHIDVYKHTQTLLLSKTLPSLPHAISAMVTALPHFKKLTTVQYWSVHFCAEKSRLVSFDHVIRFAVCGN